MRTTLKTSALAALLGLAALPALAQPGSPRPDGQPRDPARLFGQADTDHDGRVTRDEAWASLTTRFNEADANRDGGVSADELRAQVTRARPNRPTPARADDRGQAMFRAADADRDGRVTLAELQPMAEAMFRSLDRDGDGAIARDELPRPRGPRGEAPPAR